MQQQTKEKVRAIDVVFDFKSIIYSGNQPTASIIRNLVKNKLSHSRSIDDVSTRLLRIA